MHTECKDTIIYRDTVAVAVTVYFSKSTLRKWLSKSEEYKKVNAELKKTEREMKKLLRSMRKSVERYLQKLFKNCQVQVYGYRVGIPNNGYYPEYRFIVSFIVDDGKWRQHKVWSFGGKRLPKLRDKVMKYVKLSEKHNELYVKRAKIMDDIIIKHINGVKIKCTS